MEVERLEVEDEDSSDDEEEEEGTGEEGQKDDLPLSYDDGEEELEVFGGVQPSMSDKKDDSTAISSMKGSVPSPALKPEITPLSEPEDVEIDIDIAFGMKYEAVKGIPVKDTFGAAEEEVDDDTLIANYNIKTKRTQEEEDEDDEFDCFDNDNDADDEITTTNTIQIALAHAAARPESVSFSDQADMEFFKDAVSMVSVPSSTTSSSSSGTLSPASYITHVC